MKYYEELLNLGSFSKENVIKIVGSTDIAKNTLLAYSKKGYIEKIRRNYYVAISIETHQPVFNRYQIASNIYNDAYLTHHSAFEAYGYANQIFYDVYFSCKKRVKTFEYDGVHYLQTAKNPMSDIINENNIKLTSIEQTVIDSIKDYEKIAGLEEVLRCIELVPALNEEKLLNCLKVYNNCFLYQKCGYILENISGLQGITNLFINECQKHIGKKKNYLLKNRNDLILNKKWMLYVPIRFTSLIEKGAFNYDEIR